jgi:hypothetical protein
MHMFSIAKPLFWITYESNKSHSLANFRVKILVLESAKNFRIHNTDTILLPVQYIVFIITSTGTTVPSEKNSSTGTGYFTP